MKRAVTKIILPVADCPHVGGRQGGVNLLQALEQHIQHHAHKEPGSHGVLRNQEKRLSWRSPSPSRTIPVTVDIGDITATLL